MRIRNFRQEDLPELVQLQRASAEVDGGIALSEEEFERWLGNPRGDAAANAFVVTDDDDELNPWGQAGTLEGIEGEIAGYTVLSVRRGQDGYHLLCQGTVHPELRRHNAGRILLVGALNRARILAMEFESEAEEEGLPVYFEALLPLRDPASVRLAARYEMEPVDTEPVPQGMRLYRTEL